jgi:23S rRNA pseudouridine1911/1915/1917 synthase
MVEKFDNTFSTDRPLMKPINSGYSFRHALGPSATGHTTLSYLIERFDHSSPDQWLERLQAKQIRLEDSIATGHERLKPGGILIWDRPWSEKDVPIDYQILYQDEFLIAVHKPSGLPTLPGAGFYQNTLLTQVQRTYSTAKPLHRLGRATSGIVLFALDPKTSGTMSKLWVEVHKEYRTIVQGNMQFDSIGIQTPIGLIPHPRLGSIYGACPMGKSSRSIVRVLQQRENGTVCSVELLTGRPHQIRIHLASIGYPLHGDPVYEQGGGIVENAGLPGDAGYYLHAHRIRFKHPVMGESIGIEAPLPECLRIN